MIRSLAVPIALLALLPQLARAAELPAELEAALDAFRADGPPAWSYLQTTTSSGGEALVERFDAARPSFDRWSLVRKDGREPTDEETRVYREGKTRRTAGLQPPRIQDRLDRASAERISSGEGMELWRFRMLPGGADDLAAAAMAVTVAFHEGTRTITRVEIASTAAFSPALGVRIESSRTTMEYSLPASGLPSLPQRISVRLRGRAFWFRSLDEDLEVTYSEHRPATLRTP
jgi:hypothetical protein